MSDPNSVRDALDEAIDAFNEEGHGIPTREPKVDTDTDWKTQFTKGCRLLAVVEEIEDGGYYTAVVELCFGIIERSLEAFVSRPAATICAAFRRIRTNGATTGWHGWVFLHVN
ncbi:hypothetical protein [Halostagnicola sp. A-GB9-2]|uniref:hypothetical protein n=1 Tax=Halostagnicola sp. A-GB9-2 TaxID=3048066 RepID=UPI0024BFCC91|nr:hypothetical protein [Halostagnicola sp. A-GB9-2]MDJ1434801.1 hypothetical protein [Halostagnicola sp. A-GB9-2]